MALRLVRQSSNEPNISNTDDARMIRYAYGGYDGSVRDFGNNLGASVTGGVFTVGSGCIVLQGWEMVVDAQGWSLTVGNFTQLRYYSIYLEINLATETSAIKSVYSTAGYPTVEAGDDLTMQTTGTARLLLYRFKAQNGIITDVSKQFSTVPYLQERMEAVNLNLLGLANRLDELGFKRGQLSLAYRADPSNVLNAETNEVVKIGTNVYLNLNTKNTVAQTFNGYIGFSVGETIATIPEGFRPYKEIACYGKVENLVLGEGTYIGCGLFKIKTTGEIVFAAAHGNNVSVLTAFSFNAGYCIVDPTRYE